MAAEKEILNDIRKAFTGVGEISKKSAEQLTKLISAWLESERGLYQLNQKIIKNEMRGAMVSGKSPTNQHGFDAALDKAAKSTYEQVAKLKSENRKDHGIAQDQPTNKGGKLRR